MSALMVSLMIALLFSFLWSRIDDIERNLWARRVECVATPLAIYINSFQGVLHFTISTRTLQVITNGNRLISVINSFHNSWCPVSVFIVSFSFRFLCISKVFRNKHFSWPRSFLKQICSALLKHLADLDGTEPSDALRPRQKRRPITRRHPWF